MADKRIKDIEREIDIYSDLMKAASSYMVVDTESGTAKVKSRELVNAFGAKINDSELSSLQTTLSAFKISSLVNETYVETDFGTLTVPNEKTYIKTTSTDDIVINFAEVVDHVAESIVAFSLAAGKTVTINGVSHWVTKSPVFTAGKTYILTFKDGMCGVNELIPAGV